MSDVPVRILGVRAVRTLQDDLAQLAAPNGSGDLISLTEFILLGNIAILGKGKKLEWDGPNMKFTNAPEMDQYLKRTYRTPWTL